MPRLMMPQAPTGRVEARLAPGVRVSHYRLEEELGRGGMGVVYRAVDERLGRTVALKFLAVGSAEGVERRRRFIREARAASALDHPHICPVHQIDETEDGLLFLVLAFCDGESLKERLSRGPLPLNEALVTAIQVAEGLAEAHRAGIVHRDVKPGNVMLTARGARVLDFGLAHVVDRSSLTRSGAAVGTIGYMAPEQIRGEGVDRRADAWALGVLLYEMVVGRQPFVGEGTEATIYAILEHPPDPLPASVSAAASGFRPLLERLVAKDPAERPADLDEVAAELRSLRRTEQATAAMPAAAPRRSGRRARRPSRLARAAAVSVPALAAGLAVLLAWWSPPGDGPSPASPAEPTPVSVARFANLTGDESLDWLSRGVPDVLMHRMSGSGYLRVVASGGAGSEQPRWAVSGSVVRGGGEVRLMATARERRGGEVVASATARAPDTQDLLPAIDRLAGDLRVDLELRAAGTSDFRRGVERTRTDSLEAYRHYVEGLEALESLRAEEAIPALRLAVEIDPDFAHAWQRLANAYDVLGEEELARHAVERAVATAGDLSEAERLRILRRQAQLEEDLDAELAYLERLSLLEPWDAEVHFVLGWHLFTHRRRCGAAEAAYRRSLDRDPGRRLTHAYLGWMLLACGRGEEALEHLRRYVALEPDDPIAWCWLADGLRWTGSPSAADEALDTAAELDPELPEVARGRGELALDRGRLEEAGRQLESYRDRALGDRGRGEALRLLGEVALAAGRPAEARELARQARSLEPGRVDSAWLQGVAELAGGDPAAAADRLEEIEATLAETGSLYFRHLAHHLRGRWLLARGDPGGAVEELRRVVELHPVELGRFRTELARGLVADGREDEALDQLASVIALEPSYAPALLLRGRLLAERGEEAAAAASYRAALTVWESADPGFVPAQEARQGLAALRADAGRRDVPVERQSLERRS